MFDLHRGGPQSKRCEEARERRGEGGRLVDKETTEEDVCPRARRGAGGWDREQSQPGRHR